MNETMKTAFWVMLYSFLAGICLAIFMQFTEIMSMFTVAETGDFAKYIFSLLAIYIGMRYFRRFETISKRVLFVVLALFFSFFTIFFITAYRFAKNPELYTGMIMP